MAQTFPRFCPRCGTPLAVDHTVCARCDLDTAQRPEQNGSVLAPALSCTPSRSQRRKIGKADVLLLFLLFLLFIGTIGYVVVNFLPDTNHRVLQPPTTTPPIQVTVPYGCVDVSANSQMSIEGKQAKKGMRYLVLSVNVNNILSQTAIAGLAYDYARLKAGAIMALPAYTTLPVSFVAGASGQTGTVTFLILQNVAALTFTLQAQHGFDATIIKFQA